MKKSNVFSRNEKEEIMEGNDTGRIENKIKKKEKKGVDVVGSVDSTVTIVGKSFLNTIFRYLYNMIHNSMGTCFQRILR